jgi:hypothetical protein
MTDESPLTDDELLDLLAEAIATTDPTPDRVLDAAKGAYAWFGIDDELAALTFDSVTEELVGARSATTSDRQLTFTSPGVEVELSIMGDGERRLIGQFTPPAEATIVLETTDATRETTADHLGRFSFAAVDGGLLRLTIVSGATRVKTEWIII